MVANPNILYIGDVLCVPGQETVEETNLNLATTTSTVDTGLLDYLIPRFEAQTGYNVKVFAVGSGEALAMGARGEADTLLTHSPKSERSLVEKGYLINRKLVMHNDFVIVGPPDDPANIRGLKSAVEAFKRIAQKHALFISRGDYSGTNVKEMAIWERAGITPEGNWYKLARAGMAQTLMLASQQKGYTLSDRGTYLAQRRNITLDILVEGDKILLNFYHVMQTNPQKFPQVNAQGGRAFVEFMVAPETQEIIGNFGKRLYGQALFIPDAGKIESEITM